MKNIKYSSLLIVAFVLVVVSAGLYFLSNNLQIISNLSDRMTRLFPGQQSQKEYKFIDETGSYQYSVDENFLDEPGVTEIVAGTSTINFHKTITITHTNKSYGKKTVSRDGEVISAVGFNIDYPNEEIIIDIYISPEIDEADRLYEINSSVLNAILGASERNKADTNIDYVPNFDLVSDVVHEIMKKSYDVNYYYVTYDLNQNN